MNLKLASHIHSFLDSFWTHTHRQTNRLNDDDNDDDDDVK